MQAGARRKAMAGLIGLVALIAIYALAGFFLAPYLAKRELARYAQTLDRNAEAAEVRFNPFTYTVEAKGVKLTERNGEPIAAIERVYADFDFASVFRRAWRFSEVTIEGVDIALEIDRSGELNVARLAQRFEKPDRQPDDRSSPPEVIVGDLKIERATVRYADRSRAQPVSAVIGPLTAHVTGLSTLPGDDGKYTFAAKLPDGASLSAKGSIALQPLASAGELRLADFKLATAWPFVRERLQMTQPQGTATLAASYRYARDGAQPVIQVSDADLLIKDLRLATAETPLLELASARASQARYDGATGALSVGVVELAEGRYTAVLDASGQLNWAQLAAPGDGEKAAGRWSARLDQAKLTDIAVHYEDRSRRTPLALDIAQGNAALALTLAASAEGVRTTAEGIRLELNDIALAQAGSQDTLVKLGSASVNGARVDTQERVIAADDVVLAGGSVALLRDAQGNVALAQALEPAKPAEVAQPEPGPRWRYRIGAVTVQETQLAVGDTSYEPALRYDLELGKLTAQNIDADSSSPVAFEAAVKAAQGGTIRATGTASQGFDRASAQAEVAGVSLLPLKGVLDRYATLAFRSGTASATATLEYAQGGKPMLRVDGGAKLADLALDDLRTGQRFITWKQLAADGLTLTLAPDRLDIKEALLDAPESAIHISKDRKVNVVQVMKDSGRAAAEPRQSKPQSKDEAPAFPVRVGRLRVQNGALDFSDASLVLPFSTRITRLNGTVVGLAADAQSRAELKLGGRIEPSGYASAEGGLAVRHPTDFMDINVKFQNVELPPLSPYTATFAGRKIAGGRLWLDLDYNIVNQKLAGANRILLENVELGERVQAPNALDLPLDLAIALLKDSQGRINMAVPVTGDLDNPQFDYGSLIREAIASAVGRVVTAPFRALAALLGGGSADELGKVRFTAGNARIYPPEREALRKVAKALQERPQLKVIVHGPYAPDRDAERLRRNAVRRDLAQAMAQALRPGEDAGPIAYSDPETQRAIEKLYVARAGPGALRELAAQYAKERGPDTTAQSADQRRAYYESLYDRLVESHPLPDSALQQLAAERAQAIAAVLAEAGVDRGRIESGALRTVTDGTEPTVDAELELAVRDSAS